MGIRRKGAARNTKESADDFEPPALPPELQIPRPALACSFKTEADSIPEDFHGHVPGHPESPGRVAGCVERLRKSRLLHSFRRLPQRLASDEEFLLCHSAEHVAGLEKLAQLAAQDQKTRFVPTDGKLCMGGPCCDVREGEKDADTYVNPGSLRAARLAAGGVMQLVDEVMTGESSSTHCGLALCRPPGHHASRTRSQGFCLVNNVAVAAEYARTQYPEVQRVLIFDWDVHHGQGTQQIFEQSSDVLTVSFHRHDGENFYPASGGAREVGIGTGRGYSVNVPLPGGYGDAALWAACAEVLVPAARQFQPQLFIISAGFDAAAGDPLGGCTVAPRFFGVLTMELRRLAAELSEGRLVLALEGGYNLSVLEDCVEEVARALVAEAPEGMAFTESPEQPLEGSSCYGSIRRTCEAHQALPLRLKPPPSKSDRRKAAGSRPPRRTASSTGAESDGGETGGTAAAVRALGAAAIRGLGRFTGLGGAAAPPTALEAAAPEAGEDAAASSAAATADAAVAAVAIATGSIPPIVLEAAAPIVGEDVVVSSAAANDEAEATVQTSSHENVQVPESPTKKSKSRRKAQKKAQEAAQEASQSEPAPETLQAAEDAAPLEGALDLKAEPEAVLEVAEPEEQWTAPRQRRKKNEQSETPLDESAQQERHEAHDGAQKAAVPAPTKSEAKQQKTHAVQEAAQKAPVPATAKVDPKRQEATAVHEAAEKAPAPATAKPDPKHQEATAVQKAAKKATAPATAKADPKRQEATAVHEAAQKAPAPATAKAEPKRQEATAVHATAEKAPAPATAKPEPKHQEATAVQKAAKKAPAPATAKTEPRQLQKSTLQKESSDDTGDTEKVSPKAAAQTAAKASIKAEPRTKPAETCAELAPIHATCEIQPDSLVVRLSPVQRPQDIAVSTDELWVWFDLGAGPKPEARGWRFEGVRVDNSGALRSAEFRSKRKELTLHLLLGPILGGAVLLTPLTPSDQLPS